MHAPTAIHPGHRVAQAAQTEAELKQLTDVILRYLPDLLHMPPQPREIALEARRDPPVQQVVLLGDTLGADEEAKLAAFRQLAHLLTTRSDVFHILSLGQAMDGDRVEASQRVETVVDFTPAFDNFDCVLIRFRRFG